MLKTITLLVAYSEVQAVILEGYSGEQIVAVFEFKKFDGTLTEAHIQAWTVSGLTAVCSVNTCFVIGSRKTGVPLSVSPLVYVADFLLLLLLLGPWQCKGRSPRPPHLQLYLVLNGCYFSK